MALIRRMESLDAVRFQFDDAGDVSDVLIQRTYSIVDNVTGIVEASRGETKSIWVDLTGIQRTAANNIGKRFKTLAASF